MINKKPFALVLLLVLSVATPLYAQDPPQATVFLSPTTTTLAVGETTTMTIITRNAQDVYGFDISLSFTNPDTIEIIDADPNAEGVQVSVGSFLEQGFTLHNQVDHAAGTMRFAMTQMNPSPPKNGSGVLMIITLRALKPSTSTQLTLTHVEQAQPRGIMLPTTTDSTPAQLNITDNPPPPPTPQQQRTTTPQPPIALFELPAPPTPIPIALQYPTTRYDSFIVALLLAIVVVLLLLIAGGLIVMLRYDK